MSCRALPFAALLALSLLACGGDGLEPAPVERRDETAQEVPKLERGYEEFSNADAGIAFGRPPGWSAKSEGPTTKLTAPDELVSATITVDRTDEALASRPGEFATATAERIEGYRKPLDPSAPEPFASPYDAAIVHAEGVAQPSGVPQRVHVVVLERTGAAVVTAVIAEHADEKAAGREAKQAFAALGTLRTRPPS